MAFAHEDDVVIAFRQAVEEEMRRAQAGGVETTSPFQEGESLEENLRRLADSHQRLQTEVALLRTVILKLVSQPVDTEPTQA